MSEHTEQVRLPNWLLGWQLAIQDVLKGDRRMTEYDEQVRLERSPRIHGEDRAMTKILALDASTTAIGYALMDCDKPSPHDLLLHGLYKPPGDLWMRIAEGAWWLHEWLESHVPMCINVAIERPFVHKNWNSAIKQSYMVGALGAVARAQDCRIIEINPSERLKAAGISSKAPSLKRAVVERVNQVYGLGLKVTEHDIADAVLVGWAAQGKLKGEQA